MRVNPNPYPDLLAAVAQTQQQIQTDEQEIASGQSVNLPSDDPAAAAELVQNADQTSQVDQYQRSIGSLQGEMQNADSTLASVVTSLQQAISLGVEGANGTVNSADRAAIVVQVQGIQSQLLSLANLSYQGNYVFAGTKTQTVPFVLDASSPSGVTYQGNDRGEQRYFRQQLCPANQLARFSAIHRRGLEYVPEHPGSDYQPAKRHRHRHSCHRSQQCFQHYR